MLLPEQAQCNVVFLSIFLYVIWKKALYDQLERTTIQLIKNLKFLLQFNLGYISRDRYWLASVLISWMWSRRLLLKAYKFGVKRDSIMMVISVSGTIGFKLYQCHINPRHIRTYIRQVNFHRIYTPIFEIFIILSVEAVVSSFHQGGDLSLSKRCSVLNTCYFVQKFIKYWGQICYANTKSDVLYEL